MLSFLDELVGREAALGLAQVHRPSAGDDADSELLGRLDLRLEQPGFPAREHVVVVENRRAARERELGEPGAGGGVLRVPVDLLPERIEVLEPREEVGLLRPGSRQRLEEVVMRVDQAGREEGAADVLVRLSGRRVAAPDLLDEAVVDEEPAVGNLRSRVVHRDDVGVRE